MLTSSAVTFATASTVLAGFAARSAVSGTRAGPCAGTAPRALARAGRLPAASAWSGAARTLPVDGHVDQRAGVKPLPPIGTGSRCDPPLTSSVEVT